MLTPLDAGYEKFLSHPALRDEVLAHINEIGARRLPKWDAEEDSGAPIEVPDPATTQPSWSARFTTLEQLQAAPMTAEAVCKDSRIKFYVTQDGEGWAYAVDDVTVGAGSKALSWGAGKRHEAETATQLMETHSGVPYAVTSDATTVYYEASGSFKQMSMSGLINQLAVEGKPHAKIKFHTVDPAGAAGRYNV